MRFTLALLVAIVITLSSAELKADIKNWQTGQTIRGTTRITPRPGIDLSNWNTDSRNLRYADFSGGLDLSGSSFQASWLDDARFTHANLAGVSFDSATLSSADLSQANLAEAVLVYATLTNTDLSQANLTGAFFYSATLTNADFSDAVVKGAHINAMTSLGFTKEQLYSTSSFKDKDLAGIGLQGNDVSGWNFAGQNLARANFGTFVWGTFRWATTLTNADLSQANLTGASLNATLTNTDLSDAVVKGADFYGTTSRGFTEEQLYSTASFKDKDLPGIGLRSNDLSGWKFAGQNLVGADFYSAMLTNADLRHANLTGASFDSATLANADLSDAVIKGARFYGTTSLGFTQEQLYSTASYQAKDLGGIGLVNNNLSGWNFAGQNLVGAEFADATLTSADLRGANLKNADFGFARDLATAIFDSDTVYNQWTVFPRLPRRFDPAAEGLTFMPSPAGDFDGNDLLDNSDVDLLESAIRVGYSGLRNPLRFDVNSDSAISQEDLHVWVNDLKKTRFGDANLDGIFNRDDLISVLQADQYDDDIYGNSTWATGDWNADGEFDRFDLVAALQDGGYLQAASPAMAAVPEPSAVVLCFVFVIALCAVGVGRKYHDQDITTKTQTFTA